MPRSADLFPCEHNSNQATAIFKTGHSRRKQARAGLAFLRSDTDAVDIATVIKVAL
jgi:hypothetical protein